MVSHDIWIKHKNSWGFQRLSKLHESEGRGQFGDFETLTSVCFFKLHEQQYY
jgi:hypothetical protein